MRADPDRPASERVEALPLSIVAERASCLPATMTLGTFWKEVAGMGGYLARRSDGPPGWRTIWKGWLALQTLLEVVHLAFHLRLVISSNNFFPKTALLGVGIFTLLSVCEVVEIENVSNRDKAMAATSLTADEGQGLEPPRIDSGISGPTSTLFHPTRPPVAPDYGAALHPRYFYFVESNRAIQ